MILDDGGDATLLVTLGAQREKDKNGAARGHQRRRTRAVRRDAQNAQGKARLLFEDPGQHQGRDRRNHHRRAPPVPDGKRRPAAVSGDQRQRLGDEVEIRQPLRLPRIAGRRHQARHRRDDRRQDRGGVRLRRRRQGLRRGAARAVGAGVGDRNRPDLRAAGGDGRLSRRHHGRTRPTRPTSSSPPPAT